MLRSRTPRLTPRQKQIAHLISQALENKEIAHVLGLSEGTVKVYVSRIFERLHVPNRTALAVLVWNEEHSIPNRNPGSAPA
jgi:two-component system, NarL family, nitrate/nitrite response regulator NarL